MIVISLSIGLGNMRYRILKSTDFAISMLAGLLIHLTSLDLDHWHRPDNDKGLPIKQMILKIILIVIFAKLHAQL